MYPVDNQLGDNQLVSEYGTALRVSLSLVSALVVLSGTLGNFLVWYGALFRSAIRMEPCARVLITNLALSDTVMTLVLFLPLTVTLGAGRWVLGDALCQVQGIAIQVAMSIEMFIMMSLNCYRLWAVRKTRGDRDRVKVWHVYLYLGVVVVFSASSILVHYAVGGDNITPSFDTRVGVCRMFLVRNRKQNAVVLSYMVPPLVISFTASKVLKCILCSASKRAGTDNPKSQMAISLVCWAMVISYLPSYVTLLWEMFSHDVPSWVYISRAFVMSVNLVVNPIIYFIYSSSFNHFVRNVFNCQLVVNNNQRSLKTETST